jgi:hypothetical protein
MDDLYNINFQSNDKFYKIRIYYNIIHNRSTHSRNIYIFPYL